jgi:hypothetical protein
MSIEVRKGTDDVLKAMVSAWNAKQIASVASFFHADLSQRTLGSGIVTLAVTAANGSDLPTSLTLVNELKGIYNRHVADGIVVGNGGAGAHKLPDTAVSTATATDLATAITLANAIKASYNTHRASTTYHYTADATNAVAAADASDQGTLQTLINEIKTDLNAHILSAPTGYGVKLVAP